MKNPPTDESRGILSEPPASMVAMNTDAPNDSLAIRPDAILTPGSLDELANTANTEHGLAQQSGLNMVEHAFLAGEALIAAKEQLEHGKWLPWLSKNFAASQPTASRYMKIASNYSRVNNLGETKLVKALNAISGTTHVSQNSGDNEWFTPPEFIAAARAVMGTIDLDPASTIEANTVVNAEAIFTERDNGLDQEWYGNVWMNPPYAQPAIGHFADKLIKEYLAERVEQACVLVNNATETKWWQTMGRYANAVCFPSGRVRFWHPDKPSAAPLQGQSIIYLGEHIDKFDREFKPLGVVFR